MVPKCLFVHQVSSQSLDSEIRYLQFQIAETYLLSKAKKIELTSFKSGRSHSCSCKTGFTSVTWLFSFIKHHIWSNKLEKIVKEKAFVWIPSFHLILALLPPSFSFPWLPITLRISHSLIFQEGSCKFPFLNSVICCLYNCEQVT